MKLACLNVANHLFKVIMSYSCLNYHSPFRQFYTDLKILQNGPFLIKGLFLENFQGHTISGLCYRYD